MVPATPGLPSEAARPREAATRDHECRRPGGNEPRDAAARSRTCRSPRSRRRRRDRSPCRSGPRGAAGDRAGRRGDRRGAGRSRHESPSTRRRSSTPDVICGDVAAAGASADGASSGCEGHRRGRASRARLRARVIANGCLTKRRCRHRGGDGISRSSDGARRGYGVQRVADRVALAGLALHGLVLAAEAGQGRRGGRRFRPSSQLGLRHREGVVARREVDEAAVADLERELVLAALQVLAAEGLSEHLDVQEDGLPRCAIGQPRRCVEDDVLRRRIERR